MKIKRGEKERKSEKGEKPGGRTEERGAGGKKNEGVGEGEEKPASPRDFPLLRHEVQTPVYRADTLGSTMGDPVGSSSATAIKGNIKTEAKVECFSF